MGNQHSTYHTHMVCAAIMAIVSIVSSCGVQPDRTDLIPSDSHRSTDLPKPDVSKPDLSKGVNIPHWFWYAAHPADDTKNSYITSADVLLLKAAGITHVRIPFEPKDMWDDRNDILRSSAIDTYLAGAGLFTSQGIAVVIDPHPNQTPWADPTKPECLDEYPIFWSALAKRLSNSDTRYYVLEVMNEPHGMDALPHRWPELQTRTIASIRSSAPHHTIIATGDQWGSIGGLQRLQLSETLLNDHNIIYSFHFYEPMTFTHQGADWGAPNWKNLRDVPYPATNDRITESTDASIGEKGKGEVRWYAQQGWDAHKINSQLDAAVNWARSHTPPLTLYCGEFGVYTKHARADERAAWISDLRTSLESKKIGWAMWDYSGGFSLSTGNQTHRNLDPKVCKALGLTSIETPATSP